MNQQLLKAPLPWQKNQWDHLLKRWQNNNLPHALLLHGATGLGKEIFAREFAKVLLCKGDMQRQHACEKCSSCLLIQAGTYPELYLIHPEAPSKIIRIDQIRELIGKVNQTPQYGRYKIAVIAPAETMPIGAANAILKTLEEPAPNSIIMLVAEQLGPLPMTIRSRCQFVPFTAPSQTESAQWLAETGATQDNTLALALAEGAPLRAMALSEKFAQRQSLLEELQGVSKGKIDPVQLSAAKSKQPILEVIDCLLSVIMDVIRVKGGFPLSALTNSDQANFLKVLSATFLSGHLFSYLDKLYKLRGNLNGPTLNQQLMFEDLFCTWYEYTRNPIYA